MVDLEKYIPSHLFDKLKRKDEKQVDALPEGIRIAIIYGTKEQRNLALGEIRTRERLQEIELIGQAALEMLAERRTHAQGID